MLLRLALLAALSAYLSFSVGCRSSTQAEAAPLPSRHRVRTTKVTREVIVDWLRATGVLVARDRATLSFEVGGLVQRVLVRPGDEVQRGQLLARLDPRELDAAVRRAELALQKAERDQARADALWSSGAAPRQHVEDASSAAHLTAQALALARLNREHAVILAPSAGTVARRLVEPGNVVAPGMPALQLNVAGSGYVVRAGLIDRDFVRVALGDKAAIAFDAFPGRRFTGTVIGLAAEPSVLNGIYDVEVALDAPPPRQISGLVAKLEFQLEAPEPLLAVPIEALLTGDGDEASVYVVGADGRAHRTAVEIALPIGPRIGVRKGLEESERVIWQGGAFVADGALVQEAVP